MAMPAADGFFGVPSAGSWSIHRSLPCGRPQGSSRMSSAKPKVLSAVIVLATVLASAPLIRLERPQVGATPRAFVTSGGATSASSAGSVPRHLALRETVATLGGVGRIRRQMGTARRNVGEATETAARSSAPFPPPDWVRIATTVQSLQARDRVVLAVANVSEGLKLEQHCVHIGRCDQPDPYEAWSMSVWVPPNSMLLVSSVIGEALMFEPPVEAMPMVLAEGLDFESDAGFFRAEIVGFQALDIAIQALERKFAAMAEIDGVNGRASLYTTAAGRLALEPLFSGLPVSVTWHPLGGNEEYLYWVASQISPSLPAKDESEV
mmetsp:Transcript_5964/g.11177  ORF Transcript_5964/g.11177 Transcript_5964/m.11177 type:complete len:322 (+) Transcript_5964:65-1030(+)